MPSTRLLHLLSTGLLIVAVVALSFATFGPNGIGNRGNGGEGTGDGPNLNGAVPIATVPDDAETTTLPYPGPEECTVEPMTRDEMIAHIQEANVATRPERQMYERPVEPSDEDAQAIMQAFDEWRACGLDTPDTGLAYELRLQTPWYSANQLGVFINYQEGRIERPISEDEIEAYVDRVLDAEDEQGTPAPSGGRKIAPTAVSAEPEFPSTPLPPGVNEMGTPTMIETTMAAPSDLLPIPDNATPVSYEGGRAFPTIFAEDIFITGPDTATARAHFVHEDTREVMPSTPLTYGFVKVDGQWLIDSYREGTPG